MKRNLMILMCLTWWLTACTSDPLKAPCDLQGHFCGAKTKINTW